MKTIFIEGDRVFDFTYGWGTVKEVTPSVHVKFDGCMATRVWYGLTMLKTLSFTEYTLEGFSHDRPEQLPKKGDVVWAKEDKDQEFWQIGHFFKKSNNRYLITSGRPDGWCISGIVITTENPYANEHY